VFIKNCFEKFAGWLGKLFREFINVYHIENEEQIRKDVYSDAYVDKLAGTDPHTGERKISVKKILFRLVILSLIALFVWYFIRINTDVSFWGTR